MTAKGAHISCRRGYPGRQLPLHAEVELVDRRILKTRGNGFNALARVELRSRRIVVVRKNAATRCRAWESDIVNIGQRCSGTKVVANGEWHGIAGLVPLIAAGIAVEDARCGANRGLAIPERIPCKTDTRRNVAERRAGEAASDAFVPREQPGRAAQPKSYS